MEYSRSNPSPRYLELTGQYRHLHREHKAPDGAPVRLFPGISLRPHVADIKQLIGLTGARSILDYGSGKGDQYLPQSFDADGRSWEGIQDYWDVNFVACYDPCYAPFSALPEGRFDGVVSTDVLEHCPEQDVPWILDEMFGYAGAFVFVTIACHPAKKTLPNGENAHSTIKPIDWWDEQIGTVSLRHPAVTWRAKLYEITPDRNNMLEQVLYGGKAR